MFSFENRIRHLQYSALTLLYCKVNPAVWRLPDLLLCLLTIFRQMGTGGRGGESRDQVSTNKAAQLLSREATFCQNKSPGQKSFTPSVDLIFLFFLFFLKKNRCKNFLAGTSCKKYLVSLFTSF